LHDRRIGFLGTQCECRQHVGAEVDGEDLDDGQWQRNAEQDEGQIGHQFRNVRAEDVGQELPDVFEYRAPFLDRRHDAGEVVVEQDQVGCCLRHVGPADSHGDADVGGLQGRCVIDPVAGDRDDFPLVPEGFDDAHLLLGGDAGEQNLRSVQRQLQLRR